MLYEVITQIGDCVMPVEGIFAKVIKAGSLKQGEALEYAPRIIKTLVITLSDRAFNGIYEDKSGPLAAKMMADFFNSYGRYFEVERKVLPDDKVQIEAALLEAKSQNYDIIITTGGTGLGKRDITPDVVRPLLDKEIPGRNNFV